ESDRSPQPETAVVEAVSHRVIDGEGVRDGNDGALEEGEGGGGGQQGEVFVKEQEAQADSSRGQKGGDQHRAGAAGPVADQSPYGLGDHHDDGADGHQGADLTAAQADLFLQVNAQQGVKPPEGPEGQKIKQTEVGLDGSVACGHGFSSTLVYLPCAEICLSRPASPGGRRALSRKTAGFLLRARCSFGHGMKGRDAEATPPAG